MTGDENQEQCLGNRSGDSQGDELSLCDEGGRG